MKVRLQEEGLAPATEHLDMRSVVVYDDFDNPILLVQKYETGRVLVYNGRDPEFALALKTLGIGLNTTYKTVKSPVAPAH